MKIPDTIIAKVREFREKDFLDPPAVEAYLEQALLDVRRETEQEILDFLYEHRTATDGNTLFVKFKMDSFMEAFETLANTPTV